MKKFLIILILFFAPVTCIAPGNNSAKVGHFLQIARFAPANNFEPVIYFSSAALASDTKLFSAKAEKVLMASISAISKLNFEILEIQSTSGYVLFKTKAGEEYLLMVIENGEKSGVKISKMKNSTSAENVKETVMAAITNELNGTFNVVDL